MDARTGNVFVFDAWGLVWCPAWWPSAVEREVLFEQVRRVLESLDPRLEGGGRVDRVFEELDPPLYCRSFASVYVLGTWFGEETVPFAVRRQVALALPDVERLTLALPPPPESPGPRTESGEGFGVP